MFHLPHTEKVLWCSVSVCLQENKHTVTKYKSGKVNNPKTAKQNYRGSVARHPAKNEVGLFYNDNTRGPRNPYGAPM